MNRLNQLGAVLIAVTAVRICGQSTGSAFEVESIKAMPQDGRTWALRQLAPTRYRSLSNVRQLLTWAWNVRDYQIVGAPAWTSQARFDIQAYGKSFECR